jgi:hypothetical protein
VAPPVSDHFDGTRFFDPHGAAPKSLCDLLRWIADRHVRGTRAKWPAWGLSPYADRPPARVNGPAWRISCVGLVAESGYGDGWHFRHARDRCGSPIGAYEPRWFMRDQHMNPAESVEAGRSWRSPTTTARSSSRTSRSMRRSQRSSRPWSLPEFPTSASARYDRGWYGHCDRASDYPLRVAAIGGVGAVRLRQ